MASRLASCTRNLRNIAALVVIAGVLGACSSLQIGYSFLDDLIEGRAETYLELSDYEKVAVDARTGELVDWISANMLPRYAGYLDGLADKTENADLSREDVAQSFQTLRGLMEDTVEGVAPFIASILVNHTSPEKLAYFEARMAENLEERREEESAETPEESFEEWVERQQDGLERFTGDLENHQIDIIRQYAKNRPAGGLRWLENREHRQEAFLEFMSGQPPKSDIAEFLPRIMMRPHELVDPDYRAVSEARWQIREDLYFAIFQTLDDDQRDTLTDNLRGYADDLLDIAGVPLG